MTEYDFLSYEKLDDKLYVVRENYGQSDDYFNIYIVIGEDKVAVIDAGLGVTGALRKYIEENITGKRRMDCYITHGDLDHLGGSILFDHAYMNHKEIRKLEWNLNVERRFSDLSVFCSDDQEILSFCRNTYLHNENVAFEDIGDGDVINLGENRLEVIKMPGHSEGSLAFYNREQNYVLVGDAVSDYNAWQRCTDFETCIMCYQRFLKIVPEDAKIYNGHALAAVPRQKVKDMIQGFKELVNGERETDESTTWKFKMVDPEELDYRMKNHVTGSVIIGYNENVFIK